MKLKFHKVEEFKSKVVCCVVGQNEKKEKNDQLIAFVDIAFDRLEEHDRAAVTEVDLQKVPKRRYTTVERGDYLFCVDVEVALTDGS